MIYAFFYIDFYLFCKKLVMKLNFFDFIYTFIFLMIFLYAVLFSATTQAAFDPVLSVLDAYNKSVEDIRKQENPSSETISNWMREWKKRFQEAIAQNPQNANIEMVKIKLVGLNNSLGEFNESQILLQELVDGTKNPVEKIRWFNELGETFRANYFFLNVQEDARKSLNAFEQSYTLYQSLSPKIQDDGDDFGARQIIALCMAGEMAKILKDNTKSVALYQFAREIFQRSTKNAMYAVLFGYDLEYILENEMVGWIQCENIPKACTILKMFSKLQSYRWPPSYYALKYATLSYENDPENFQIFVVKWLEDNHDDERTPILMAYLGFSYFDDGLFEQSLPIYKILRNKQDSFQKLEPDAFRDGRGGCYDRILSDLAVIYLRSGEIDEAEKVKEELKKLLPQSPNIDMLSSENFLIDRFVFKQQQQQWIWKYWFFRSMLIVAGLILIILGFYFRWRDRYVK
jgi:tetratricopeptide (TPR) repeat protein